MTMLLLTLFVPGLNETPKPINVDKTDWAWWRGPTHNGVTTAESLTTGWSDARNVAWKAKVPGRGHGSAIVVGNQVLIQTADAERGVQSVLCLDFATGKEVWEAEVHRGGIFTGGNKKASQASSTPACDGEHIFVSFLNRGAIHTSAISRQGKVVWQTKISDYVVHQGYGASPLLFEDLVIIAADNKGGGKLAALRRSTGDIVWERERPKKPNYPSPVIYELFGKKQLLLTGCDMVTSLNPRTGEEYWEVEGATTECVTTTVTDGTHIFTSGGYPKNHVSAVVADGSGKTAWEVKSRVYVPSMVVHDKHLYAVLDAGVVSCRRCADGEEVWKQRIGGTHTSSLTMVNDVIFATDEKGVTTAFKATPDGFQQVAKNKLKAQVFSTPTFSRGRMFLRAAKNENGRRQEYLYCIGQ